MNFVDKEADEFFEASKSSFHFHSHIISILLYGFMIFLGNLTLKFTPCGPVYDQVQISLHAHRTHSSEG